MNSKFHQSLTVAVIVAVALWITSYKRALEQGKIVIAIQPTVGREEILKKAQPLQAFLEKSLGDRTKVDVYVPTSDATVVESRLRDHTAKSSSDSPGHGTAFGFEQHLNSSTWLRKGILLPAQAS